MAYYFGYGSNMSARVMRRVCPNYKLISMAQLSGYRLAFTRESVTWGHGVADVVRADGQSVWGVLYAIDDVCLDALDIKESVGVGYDRLMVEVFTPDGKSYEAITYLVINKLEAEISPSRAYAETFIEGAEEHGLPVDYLNFLKSITIADDEKG